jgi:hypothetical protein
MRATQLRYQSFCMTESVRTTRTTWIEWSKRGDGAGDRDFGSVQMRNMLPSPRVHRSIQDTRRPGDEKRVMGFYLPKVSCYRTERAFERLGCPV